MDAAQQKSVQALIVTVTKALDLSIADEVPAWDLMVAVLANAVAISKKLEIDENEFFDLVVKVYGWTHLDRVETALNDRRREASESAGAHLAGARSARSEPGPACCVSGHARCSVIERSPCCPMRKSVSLRPFSIGRRPIRRSRKPSSAPQTWPVLASGWLAPCWR